MHQHVLSKCCGALEEISQADTDTGPFLQVSSHATRQPLSNPAHLSSPASSSVSSQASPLRFQVSAVSLDKSHSVKPLTPQIIRTTVQVNPPPLEDELWPDPPPPVCHDIPYRAREGHEFPISSAISISRLNPVQLAAKKSVAQPYYGQDDPGLVNSVQNPASMPPRWDISQVKSSHLYLYSAFNNTNCVKATAQYQNGKIVSIM